MGTAACGRHLAVRLARSAAGREGRAGRRVSCVTQASIRGGDVPIETIAGLVGCRAALITSRVIMRRVLRSFRDRDTEAIWHRQRSRRLDGPTQRVAWRKLAMLDAAETLADLRIPPGNRLEKLTGDRAGQYSIRISRQWRVCFTWTNAGPEDVEITDYH